MTCVSLWQRFGRADLSGTILLALALAALAAGTFADQADVGRGIWLVNLAIAFLVCSALIWQRGPLRRTLQRIGARTRVGRNGAAISRSLLVALAAVPAVALTVAGAAAVVQGLAVQSSVGGIFARISPSVSYLVPLGLLALAMVGHAFRERSGGYAFTRRAVGGIGLRAGLRTVPAR